MLGKLKQLALYVLFGLVVVWWLISSSRRAGRRAAELKQKAATLDKVKKANEVEQDIDRLTPDERRQRLRNSRK